MRSKLAIIMAIVLAFTAIAGCAGPKISTPVIDNSIVEVPIALDHPPAELKTIPTDTPQSN